MQLDRRCLKIDWHNALMMIDGYERPDKPKYQSIWVAMETRRFPALITLNQWPSQHKPKLSDFGKDLDTHSFRKSFRFAFVATLVSEYFIENRLELCQILCTNGLFDIWDPKAPYDLLTKSRRDPSQFRIQLLRVFEIEERFTHKDITVARSDHIVPRDLEVSVEGSVMTQAEFETVETLLEESVSSYVRSDAPTSVVITLDGQPDSESSRESQAPARWSDAELGATVAAYLAMLDKENRGETYVKSRIIEGLRDGELRDRTRGSVEYIMQNIFAVLSGLGLKWIAGFPPADHVGTEVRKRLSDDLVSKGFLDPSDFEPTPDQRVLDERSRHLREKGLAKPPRGSHKPRTSTVSRDEIMRDPAVHAWVLQEADGVCELCRVPGPFQSRRGELYLEVHHVVFLADGGPDVVENAVALCPNCHRHCHYGGDADDVRTRLYESIDRLESGEAETNE